MATAAPCRRMSCGLPRAKGRQLCSWHIAMGLPIEAQTQWCDLRRVSAEERPGYAYRARVPSEQWPAGRRWCSDCQAFIPLFYCTGSKCKPHASRASHERAVGAEFGLLPGEYDALLKLQGGVCAICGRTPRGRRLAVDHDHHTGQVRGLLCGGTDHCCNTQVVGTLEGATGGTRGDLLLAARALYDYFDLYPYERLKAKR